MTCSQVRLAVTRAFAGVKVVQVRQRRASNKGIVSALRMFEETGDDAVLDMRLNRPRAVDCVRSLITRCSNLRDLYITSTPRLTDRDLERVAQACPRLAVIDFRACSRVGSRGVAALARACPQLDNVFLSRSPLVGDEAVDALGQACAGMLQLSVAGCSTVSNRSLAGAVRAWPHLAALDMSGLQRVGDPTLEALGQACGQLATLRAANTNVTSAGLAALARGCGALTTLVLAGCRGVGDAGLAAVARANPGLQHVDVWGCRDVSDDGVVALGDHCAQLQALFLGGSVARPRRITSSAVVRVARGCPRLHVLDLTGCRAVGDEAALALSRNSGQLACLCMAGVWNITDRALTALASGCPLELLDVSGCHQLTDVGMYALARNAERLRVVDVSGVTLVTQEALTMLRTRAANASVGALIGGYAPGGARLQAARRNSAWSSASECDSDGDESVCSASSSAASASSSVAPEVPETDSSYSGSPQSPPRTPITVRTRNVGKARRIGVAELLELAELRAAERAS